MAAVAGMVSSFQQIREGMRARVVSIDDSKGELNRLQEMGLTPGAIFHVVKIAPFGDPIEIELRGYRLCLRKREAAGIVIELVS